MPTPYEEISKNRASIGAIKADANLANDSNKLGGIDAEEYATKEYVKRTEQANSERDQKYTNDQIKQTSENLKGYVDTEIENIDLTPYAKKADLEAESEILRKHCEQSCQNTLSGATSYADTLNKALSERVNGMNTDLSNKYADLFQSVSNGKTKIAEAITDKGVTTSATDTFDKMSSNIKSIQTGGSGLDTSDATATAGDIQRGKTAYARGEKLVRFIYSGN